MRRFLSAIIVIGAGAFTSAAFAGQPGPTDDISPLLPPPADIGKPRVFAVQPYLPVPEAARSGDRGCLPALPCGTRLIGSSQRRDGIAIEVPALRW